MTAALRAWHPGDGPRAVAVGRQHGHRVHFKAGADVAGLQPDAGLLTPASSTPWLRVQVMDRRG